MFLASSAAGFRVPVPGAQGVTGGVGLPGVSPSGPTGAAGAQGVTGPTGATASGPGTALPAALRGSCATCAASAGDAQVWVCTEAGQQGNGDG